VFDGGTGRLARQWLAYEPEFRGGITVSTGDMVGDSYVAGSCQTGAVASIPDGADEIVTGPGPGREPLVKVFDGHESGYGMQFVAYDERFRGGVFVAAGDLAGYIGPTVVTGAGAGGGPHVRVHDGNYPVRGVMAFDASLRTGVRVAVADVNADGKADLIAGAGPGTRARVVAIDAESGTVLREFAFDPAFRGGVFVG
jgi:FG-GAP repeat